MKRIYHTYEKWECYPAGLYETTAPDKMSATDAHRAYAEFLRDIDLFERCLAQVIMTWKYSCEHYLSNEKMNRIAWLGQAAVCFHCKIPNGFCGGFNLLTEAEQSKANDAALKWLNFWLQLRGEPDVTMEGAGIAAKADIY